MSRNQSVAIIEEGELVELTGSLQSQASDTPALITDIETKNPDNEQNWLINLNQYESISLRWCSPQDDSPILTDKIKAVQLVIYSEQMYKKYRSLLLSGRQVTVRGRMFPRIMAHDHGDALIDVDHIYEAN
jgi:hypothetical protein